MRCCRSYPIAYFENLSPDTLKMADNYMYSKVCLGGNCHFSESQIANTYL